MSQLSNIETWAKQSDEPLVVSINDTALELQHVLRHLSGKRLTCRATWQGQTVIAKLFYGSGHKHYALKEKLNLEALNKAGVKAAKLLHTTEQADAALLLIGYIDKAVSLADWLKTEPKAAEFKTVMSAMTRLILTCHDAGFILKDPHLDNFLLRNDQLTLIDAGDIAYNKSSVSTAESIKNMALFYAQLAITWDEQTYQVLHTVTADRSGWDMDQNNWAGLLIKQRRWRQKRFIDKKVFRSCTPYICQQTASRFLVAKRGFYTEEIEQALKIPDQLIEAGQLLKDGRTATVARIEIQGKSYVLKRYNIKNPVYSLLRGLIWSRAAVSWKNGLVLEMLGIPTALSYALIEERWGPIRRRSYLLSEYIDAPRAWDIFENQRYDDEARQDWAKKIQALFELLKSSQISHGDLKAQNILCADKGPMFIDLDGMKSKQGKKMFLRQYTKDIQRFHISWPLKWKINPYFILTPDNKNQVDDIEINK